MMPPLNEMAHDLTHIVLCLVAIIFLLGVLCLVIGKISGHFQALSKKAQRREIKAHKHWLKVCVLDEMNFWCVSEFPQVGFTARHLRDVLDDKCGHREALREGRYKEPSPPENIEDHEGEVKSAI